MSNVVDAYPGLYRDVQTYLRERVREVLTGTSEAIVAHLWPRPRCALRQGGRSQTRCRTYPVSSTRTPTSRRTYHTRRSRDLAAAQAHGLKPGDVRRQASTLVASEEVGDIFRGGKAYDVHVWSTPETRNSVSSLRQLPIDTPGGEQITLEQVADVRLAPNPQRHRARESVAPHGRRRQRGGTRSRLRRERRRGSHRGVDCRLSTTWRCWESPASWQLPRRTC